MPTAAAAVTAAATSTSAATSAQADVPIRRGCTRGASRRRAGRRAASTRARLRVPPRALRRRVKLRKQAATRLHVDGCGGGAARRRPAAATAGLSAAGAAGLSACSGGGGGGGSGGDGGGGGLAASRRARRRRGATIRFYQKSLAAQVATIRLALQPGALGVRDGELRAPRRAGAPPRQPRQCAPAAHQRAQLRGERRAACAQPMRSVLSPPPPRAPQAGAAAVRGRAAPLRVREVQVAHRLPCIV